MRRLGLLLLTVALITACNSSWLEEDKNWVLVEPNVVLGSVAKWDRDVTLEKEGDIYILNKDKDRLDICFRLRADSDEVWEDIPGSPGPAYSYYLYVRIPDIPYRVSNDGQIKFSGGTVDAFVQFEKREYDVQFVTRGSIFDSNEVAKARIDGKMTLDDIGKSIWENTGLSGNLEIRIAFSEDECILLKMSSSLSRYVDLDTEAII